MSSNLYTTAHDHHSRVVCPSQSAGANAICDENYLPDTTRDLGVKSVEHTYTPRGTHTRWTRYTLIHTLTHTMVYPARLVCGKHKNTQSLINGAYVHEQREKRMNRIDRKHIFSHIESVEYTLDGTHDRFEEKHPIKTSRALSFFLELLFFPLSLPCRL